MSDYRSSHTGEVIDSAVSQVINGTAGIQGVKIAGTELSPDSSNKINITLAQTTGTSTTSIMSQDAVSSRLLKVESGPWTPEFVPSSSTASLPTYTVDTWKAVYYRIGAMCFIHFDIKINVITSGTTLVQIGGLPYTSYSGGTQEITNQAIPLGQVYGLANVYDGSNYPAGSCYIGRNENKLKVRRVNRIGTYDFFKADSTCEIIYSGAYMINESYY